MAGVFIPVARNALKLLFRFGPRHKSQGGIINHTSDRPTVFYADLCVSSVDFCRFVSLRSPECAYTIDDLIN